MWHYSMERSRVPLNTKRGEQLKTNKWKHGRKRRSKMKKREQQIKDSEKIVLIVGVIAIVSIMILGITCN